MSLYLGENKIADNTCSQYIGKLVASIIPINDASLHLLDGAVISSVGSYAKFVNHIAGLVTDCPELFVSESDWQSSVSTYGVCGKFVYDSTNNTVRLPKITGLVEGTTDVTALGDLVQAGLPNITGFFELAPGATIRSDATANGAFDKTTAGSYAPNFVQQSGFNGLTFDASRSSSIYGNSNTVQPQAIKVLYYIVIASSITNELNLDVADMADKDFSNITSAGTSLASGWSMPSSRYIDLTLGASGATYTAPANGYFTFLANAGNSTSSCIMINNSNILCAQGKSGGYNNSYYVSIPVKKGQSMELYYNAGSLSSVDFRFIYAEGENV